MNALNNIAIISSIREGWKTSKITPHPSSLLNRDIAETSDTYISNTFLIKTTLIYTAIYTTYAGHL